MFAIGLVQAASGIIRHRYAVTNWLTAAYRTVQLVGRQAVTLGGTLPRKVSTGEVVAIGTSDLEHLGNLMDVSARFAAPIVSFVIVAVILLQTSVTLGLVVLIGVPVLTLLVGPLLRPLQVRSTQQRELMGSLSNTANDIVAGLRVLRGIGGEQVFHDRYTQPVADDPPRRGRGGAAPVGARCAPGVPARGVRGAGGVDRRALRGRGADLRRRAGRVLRLLGVPDDPAAHRHRVRQQADPRAGGGATGVPRARADHRPPRPRAAPASPPVRVAAARPAHRPDRRAGSRSWPSSASSPTSPRRWPSGSA